MTRSKTCRHWVNHRGVLELALFCTVEAAFTANCIGQWTFTSLLCCYSFRRIRSEAEQRRKFDNLSVATFAAKSKQKRERIRRNERALGRPGVPGTPRICYYANWSAWHLFPLSSRSSNVRDRKFNVTGDKKFSSWGRRPRGFLPRVSAP